MKKPKGKLFTGFILVQLIFLNTIFAARNEANKTYVESTVKANPDTNYTYFKDEENQNISDSEILFNVPGLALTSNGGHLATSKIRYRGLSDSLVDINFEGLRLNNPLSNISTDANSMFLFAADKIESNAQSLSFSLPPVYEPSAKATFGFGSQNTLKSTFIAKTPLNNYSSLYVGTQISSTNGRYRFSSPHVENKGDNNFVRKNNDNHRLQSVVKYRYQKDGVGAHVLLATSIHEGGIPGFAFAPTNNLRANSKFFGSSLGIEKSFKDTTLSATLRNSLFDYKTQGQDNKEDRLLSSTHEFDLGFKPKSLPPYLDLELKEHLIFEQAYSSKKNRLGGGFSIFRTTQFKGWLKPKLFSNMTILGYQKHGILMNKDLGLTIIPTKRVSLTLRFARSKRLPTFMELYAKNAFFVGNKDLEPESVMDIEVATKIRLFSWLAMQATGYLGYLGNAIVYVPYLHNKLRPRNTSSAKRHGIDLALTIEPTSWILLESKNSFLHTKIKSTNARLPHAPGFLGLTKLRLGEKDFISLTLQTRYRGKTSANMYGGLNSKGYALVDSFLKYQVNRFLGFSFSINNILDTTTAKDTYEMPLAGRSFFAQVEIGENI